MEEPGWFDQAENDPQQDLQRSRLLIDTLDQQICVLLNSRLQAARALTEIKARLQIPTQDQKRENDILQKLAQSAGDDHEMAAALQFIYRGIFNQSRNLQEKQARQAPSPPGVNIAYFPSVMIIGLGLIGGSLSRQIKACHRQTRIYGVDNQQTIAQAISAQVIDAGTSNFRLHAASAGLIILAASPNQNLQLLRDLAGHLKPGQVVMDVGSCKSSICQLAQQLDLNGADFIGGHPLFGSEKSGFAAGLELDLQQKVFCLTPGSRVSPVTVKRLSRWLASLGFKVELVSSAEHDQQLSKLSHLVQILAAALGAEIKDNLDSQELQRLLQFAGPSFRQLSRLMGSPFQLWKEIIEQNRDLIAGSLQSYIKRLEALQASISGGDNSSLQTSFAQAKAIADILHGKDYTGSTVN